MPATPRIPRRARGSTWRSAAGRRRPTSAPHPRRAGGRGAAALDERTIAELRAAIDVVLEHWTVRLREALVTQHGDGEGTKLAAAFAEAFPSDYTATTSVERAVDDVGLVAAAIRT